MQPWFSYARFETLRKDIESLVDSMNKYKEYLHSKCDKVKECQQALTLPPREKNASLVTISARNVLQNQRMLNSNRSYIVSKCMSLCFWIRTLWSIGETKMVDRYKASVSDHVIQICLWKSPWAWTYAWRVPENQPADSTLVSRILVNSNQCTVLEQCGEIFIIDWLKLLLWFYETSSIPSYVTAAVKKIPQKRGWMSV